VRLPSKQEQLFEEKEARFIPILKHGDFSLTKC